MHLAELIEKREWKRLTWYEEQIPSLSEEVKGLLTDYSNIPHDELETHLHTMRDRAFDLCPYPCIGMWLFLDISIAASPWFNECLERLQQGQVLLEAGACMAQNLRYLVSFGAPSENVWATDLKKEFLDISYDLFQDRTSLKSLMLGGDLLANDMSFSALEGQLDMVYSSFLLHLFTFEDQRTIAKKMTTWLKRTSNNLIFGRAMGTDGKPNHVQLGSFHQYKHSPKSFKQLWDEVGEELGLVFEVEAFTDRSRNGTAQAAIWDQHAGDDSLTFLIFAVRLVVA